MDELVIVLLSRAPLARDLRFVVVAVKNLRRTWSEWDEARRHRQAGVEAQPGKPQSKPYVDIPPDGHHGYGNAQGLA